MYEVIVYFTDLQDKEHEYHPGDTFPRDGVNASAARIKELSSKKNRRGIPLIKKVSKSDSE